MAQLVERVLGKDEVTSSNLVSSSKKDFAEMQSPFLFAFLRGHAVKKVVGSISFLKKNGLFAPVYNFDLKFAVFLL